MSGTLQFNNGTSPIGEVGYDETSGGMVLRGLNGGSVLVEAPRQKVVSVSANYTVGDNDDTVYVDASGGAVTITLPSLSGNLGRKITVRATDATNTITVARAGSDTIANALTSVTLSSDRDYWTLEAGPDQWELVAGYESGAWTPSYTNITEGNGTTVCHFTRDNNGVVTFALKFTLGSTSAMGTSPSFTLPYANTKTIEQYSVNAYLTETGVSIWEANARVNNSSNVCPIFRPSANKVSSITADVPFTWASGDAFEVAGTYQI